MLDLFSTCHPRQDNLHSRTALIAYSRCYSIDLPTQPILVKMNISEEMSAQLQAPFIAFEWNNTSSDDESTFMMYEIHRTKDNSPLNLMTPYSTSQGSFFMDQSLQPGTYHYYVRAMHQNGVNSNLSSPLQVTIDPPPPDTTPRIQ